MTQPSERTVRAEIAIRESIADLMCELAVSMTVEDVNELHNTMCELEHYLETATDSAEDKAELLLRSRG